MGDEDKTDVGTNVLDMDTEVDAVDTLVAPTLVEAGFTVEDGRGVDVAGLNGVLVNIAFVAVRVTTLVGVRSFVAVGFGFLVLDGFLVLVGFLVGAAANDCFAEESKDNACAGIESRLRIISNPKTRIDNR